MTTFVIDLWHDLREKRLWPVAVGLLAAAIAIPMIMLKPASEVVDTPTVVANAGDDEALPAVSVDHSPSHGSKLESFDQRNPFRPLGDLQADPAASSPSGGSAPSGPAAPGGSAGAAAGKGGGSTGSTGSSGGSGGSTPSAGGSIPSPGGSGAPSVQWFRYTADIRFGTPAETKRMNDVQSLTLLPDEKNAAVVFMGVSEDAKSAIFFIADPSFTTEGEGECNSDEDCRFVKLGLGDGSNEQSFVSEDGSVQYDLELLKLNRENITAGDAKGDTTDSKSKPKAKAASTIKQVSDVFLPRLLYGPGVVRETK